MSEREPDFEFDFFDEPETREAQSRERTLRRPLGGRGGNGRGPRRPIRPAAGFTPLLRLVGLIAFAILIVVLLVLWGQSCQEDRRQDTYRAYVTAAAEVGQESQRIGRRLSDVLTTPEITPTELQTQLNGLANQQRLATNRARALDPPGPLRRAHESLVVSLEFREAGLAGMGAAFARTAGTQDANAAGTLLASQAQRLVASDVIWDDRFAQPATEVLRAQDVSGVEVPDSNFVQTPDLASQRSMIPIWQRVNGAAPTGDGGQQTGGLHGTGLEGVRVLPGGQTLSPTGENTVVASTDLAFEVSVRNTGDNQEVSIEVTLTIQQAPNPVTKKQTIDLINPDEVKTVTFRDFPSIDFGEPRTLRVDVAPVPQEANTSNNSAEYRVTFSVE
ncbi:MAG TPA: CARDB domain-containing protein [Gaiellaceae bacterium]|nr:CARDB domain-containing protein [Gaiellaceae bacterium]